MGTGTPESCTEATLDQALEGGGLVTFDCGAEPATIAITNTKAISSETAVDGGGLVTLDGNHAVGVFSVAEQTTLSVENLTIANGYAEEGGGILNSGTLTVTNSTFVGNSSDPADPVIGGGGAILNAGTLTVTNSTFSGNIADVGGGIFNAGTPSPYGPALALAAAFTGRYASVVPALGLGGTVTGTNTTVFENTADAGGGAGNGDGGTLTVTNSTFSGNVGGGIYNAGTLTVTNSTFSGSSGDGGIVNQDGGTLTVTNSTFSGNSSGALGGGGILNIGRTMVTNSTFSENTGADGGGIWNGGTLTLINSTLSRNSGNGVFNHYVGTLMISNTIIADSTDGGDCVNAGPGTVTDGGHNLIGDAASSCGLSNGENGNLVGVDPLLEPDGLQDNGGATQTIALLPDSPAIDAGDLEVCTNPPVNGLDQRGYVRPGVGHAVCSIGAYEADAIPVAACVGDCDGDGMVAVNELILGVDIALGEQPVGACPAFMNADGMVGIAQLITGVNNALDGCTARREAIEAFVDAYVEQKIRDDSAGMAISITQAGDVQFEKMYGLANIEEGIPIGPDTQFDVGSVTKQFTAMAVMLARKDGRLELDESILAYLPEGPEEWSPITVHHLLTHRAGFEKDAPLLTVIPLGDQAATNEDVLAWAIQAPLRSAPGETTWYSNVGYVLAALIVERVTGQRFEDFVADRILLPLEMDSSLMGYAGSWTELPKAAVPYLFSYVTPDSFRDTNHVTGHTGLYTTLDDLKRWEAELRHPTLLSAEDMKVIFTPHVPYEINYARLRSCDEYGGAGTRECFYGYGWIICTCDESGRTSQGHDGSAWATAR